MSQPRISIITPNFNDGRFLERAICSVLDQGYTNLQYIVVDAGSTDSSSEVIDCYRDELSKVIRKPCDNVAAAINLGLTHADGDIVSIVHSNDLLLPNALRNVAQRMTRDDQPRWLVGNVLRIGQYDQDRGRTIATAPHSFSSFLRHDSGVLPTAAAFYQRSLLAEVGSFDEAAPDAFTYDMHCRILAAGVSPAILSTALAAQREKEQRPISDILKRGLAYVEAAHRHGDRLPLNERYTLWKNCDERRRIYAMAEAEASASESRKFLWQRLLRRPWWVASDRYRHMLLHGVPENAVPRHAA